jgi:hypothetical protein
LQLVKKGRAKRERTKVLEKCMNELMLRVEKVSSSGTSNPAC